MTLTGKAVAEWKAFGTIVLASFAGFSMLSVLPGSLGMFIEPVGKSFHWSRTLVTSGYTAATIITGVLSPFFGIVLDRYGARRVGLPGIIATTLSISLFYFTNGSPTQWIIFWVIYGLVALGIKTTVWTAAVSGVFTASRGLALGLALCGTAVAQITLPPFANALIAHYGWRTAYLVLGLSWGGATLLVCWIFLYDALSLRSRRGRFATLAARDEARPSAPAPVLAGLTLGEAARSRDLWLILLSTLVVITVTMGFQIHQVPILEEAGVSRSHAALLSGLSGVAAICGKLITGALLDRFRPNWVGGLTLAGSALAFALVLQGTHIPLLIVLALLANGYTQGTTLQICSYLTVCYAGMRHYGKIFGLVTSVIAVGSGIGPLLASSTYDRYGNYGPYLMVALAGSLLAALLMLLLGPPPADWPATDGQLAEA